MNIEIIVCIIHNYNLRVTSLSQGSKSLPDQVRSNVAIVIILQNILEAGCTRVVFLPHDVLPSWVVGIKVPVVIGVYIEFFM